MEEKIGGLRPFYEISFCDSWLFMVIHDKYIRLVCFVPEYVRLQTEQSIIMTKSLARTDSAHFLPHNRYSDFNSDLTTTVKPCRYWYDILSSELWRKGRTGWTI